MGFDIPGSNISQGNTARNLLSADYLVSSGPYMTETAYKKSYKLQNLYEGQILEEGFPRNDKLFENTENSREGIDSVKCSLTVCMQMRIQEDHSLCTDLERGSV